MLHAAHDNTVPVITEEDAATGHWEALANSPLDFTICREHYDNESVIMLSAGGYGDILDVSNGAFMTEWAETRQPWVHVHHGMMNYTALCIEPSLCDDDVFAELMALCDEYDRYPILDESDYSERESKAFEDEFQWNTSRILGFDTDHPLYATAGRMAWMLYGGYSEPGFISAEHTLNAWQETLAEAARKAQGLQ